ncbi:MAG: carboxypeptidase regulatory-like domain-containing protein [Halobacteriaceae archaeon]
MSMRELLADDRAIEGLPVRLVIAFIVGVTTLSLMLNMVSGLGGFAVSELDAQPDPEVINTVEGDVNITVVDANGDPVAGATVIVRSDTATISGIETATSGDDGVATVRLDPKLGPNQQDGTLEVDIKPPAEGQFSDKRENAKILVLEETN